MNSKIPLAVLLTLGAGVAFAQEDSGAMSFSELDTNSDLQISPEEAQADADVLAQFMTLDQNGNGYVDSAEFSRVDRGGEQYQ